ncbi:THAP domain-containing protein 9 [Camponotus japonicus]
MSALLTNLKCAGCDKFLHKVSGQKKKIQTEDEAIYFSNMLQRTITVRAILCGKCRLFQFKKNKLDIEDESDKQSTSNDPTVSIQLKSEVNESNDERIEVEIQRTVSTHKYCCICSATKNITVIPEEARMQSFIKMRLYIPAGNRCCRTHLIKNRFYEEDLSCLRVYSNSSNLSASELTKMMKNLSIKCDSTLYDKIGDFSLSEKQLFTFTGLTWENIILLRDMLTSMRNRQTRTVTQALVVFLLKLRTGNSNKILASVLQIEYEQLISEYSTAILKSFEEDVLPYRFGLTSSIRDDLIDNHTTEIAKNLFDIHDH